MVAMQGPAGLKQPIKPFSASAEKLLRVLCWSKALNEAGAVSHVGSVLHWRC